MCYNRAFNARGDMMKFGTDYTVDIIIDDNDQLLLLSNDHDFLASKIKVIEQYTKNTYPSTQLGQTRVELFNSSEVLQTKWKKCLAENPWLAQRQECAAEPSQENMLLLELINPDAELAHTYVIFMQNYSYALRLDPILPYYIKNMLRMNRPCNRFPMNCHGAAHAVAGIFPSREYFNHFPTLPGRLRITPDELCPGDLVVLDRAHSFVWLDEDICFSANGYEQPLKIYHTNFVTTVYSAEKIGYFRKKPELDYSDELQMALVEHEKLFLGNRYLNLSKNKFTEDEALCVYSLYLECHPRMRIHTDQKKLLMLLWERRFNRAIHRNKLEAEFAYIEWAIEQKIISMDDREKFLTDAERMNILEIAATQVDYIDSAIEKKLISSTDRPTVLTNLACMSTVKQALIADNGLTMQVLGLFTSAIGVAAVTLAWVVIKPSPEKIVNTGLGLVLLGVGLFKTGKDKQHQVLDDIQLQITNANRYEAARSFL